MRVKNEGASEYEFTHGTKPRGFGAWSFEVVWSDGKGACTTERYSDRGTYGEVKAAANRHARHAAPGAAKSATVWVCT